MAWCQSVLESPSRGRSDHFSNIIADREFSSGCYLFTVSNWGLISVTKRVSTTPSQPRPLPSRHLHIPELTYGFNNSNDVKSSGLFCEMVEESNWLTGVCLAYPGSRGWPRVHLGSLGKWPLCRHVCVCVWICLFANLTQESAPAETGWGRVHLFVELECCSSWLRTRCSAIWPLLKFLSNRELFLCEYSFLLK